MLVPLHLDDAGYGAIAIAAVFVVAGLIEVVLNPLVGRVSDRRGRLLPVRVSLVGHDRRRLRAGVRRRSRSWSRPSSSPAPISSAGFYTPGMALVADRAERAGLPQGIGFGVTNSAWAAGALIGPAVGGALAQAFGDAGSLPALRCALRAHAAGRDPRRGAPATGLTAGNRSSAHAASSGCSR